MSGLLETHFLSLALATRSQWSMIMVHVPLSWKRIEWQPHDTWKKHTLPKLLQIELQIKHLIRSVYVIRLNGDYCIEYPKGHSPVLYVGEGNFNQRINSHRRWVSELRELVGEFSFQVRIAVPRVRNNTRAYLDCEAVLLQRFGYLFGSAPLWNKQFEKRRNNYSYNQSQIDQAICKGRGAKYKWAIKPMKASPFYADFVRTHKG